MSDRQKAANKVTAAARAAKYLRTVCDAVLHALTQEGRPLRVTELRYVVQKHDPNDLLASDIYLRTVRLQLLADGAVHEYIDTRQRHEPVMIALVGQRWKVRAAQLDGIAETATIALTGHLDETLYARVRAGLVHAVVAHGGHVEGELPAPVAPGPTPENTP